MNEPALDVDCPVCLALAGFICHGTASPHIERRDLAGDPGPFAMADPDRDGEPAAFDDPGFCL